MSSLRQAIQKLRGARHLELLLVLGLISAIALLLLRGGVPETVTTGTPLEARMEAVLSKVQGAGRVRVLLREKDQAVSTFSQGSGDPLVQVEGAVVVAEGADDVRVALELMRAVKALLGVDAERIEVLRMERSGGG